MKYKNLVKELRGIAKQYNCKVRIRPNAHTWAGAAYRADLKTIILNRFSFRTKDYLVSSFFHELQHHIDSTITGRFKKHYNLAKNGIKTKKQAIYYVENLYKLEKYTDIMAEKHKKKIYPRKYKFRKTYRTWADKIWVESTFQSMIEFFDEV